MSKKEVAKTGTGTEVMDYGDYAGTGFEDVKSTDLSIPFLNVLQPLSKVITENLIEGAKAGQILNTVTSELMDEFVFIPVHREEAWVEWVPRIKGGGFVDRHEPSSQIVTDLIEANGGERIPPMGPDGRIPFKHGDNEVIETYYMYGLILNVEGTESQGFGILSFTSTKIKAYRDWLTSMFMLKGKPPIFANRAKIKTAKQKNDAGTYHIFSIMPLEATWSASLIRDKELLDEAVQFRKMVTSGVATADFNQQNDAGGNEAAPVDGSAPF